jgi:GNAT superfamily N-acetyltransferase
VSSFAIRDYEPGDATACAGIFERAWRVGHPYAQRTIDTSVLAQETQGERIFLAESGVHGVAGFVSLYAPQSFIHHLYVDPDLHGRGVGRALLNHALREAGGRASLKCQTRNREALAFYRRLGWRDGETGAGAFGPWVLLHSP